MKQKNKVYFLTFGFQTFKKEMKLNTNTIKTLLLIVGSIALMSNRGGSPGGRTGSSTDGGTCATNGGCHGPKIPTPQEMISTNIPAAGYIPGETYTFTVSATKMNVQVWGFEMMCEDSSGNPIGVFDTTGNNEVSALQNSSRATHKFASTSSNGFVSWSVDWVAPESGTGDVDIYCAVLATNNSNSTGGDNVLIDTLTLSENISAMVSSFKRLELRAYPNPILSDLNISGIVSSKAKIEIYNSEMKQVKSIPFDHKIDLSNLTSGMYVLKVIDKDAIFMKHLIKQ
ncbi:MAG: T9SS type A sorting domain-containing protein [Bacteroidia bacterium]|nr:T9SS type A sorting domain-containing protein [Bacteroidia bacterium]NNJ55076.1 T9SS type A sorting domain-containing protein [Bacteroidia bacterium]